FLRRQILLADPPRPQGTEHAVAANIDRISGYGHEDRKGRLLRRREAWRGRPPLAEDLDNFPRTIEQFGVGGPQIEPRIEQMVHVGPMMLEKEAGGFDA